MNKINISTFIILFTSIITVSCKQNENTKEEHQGHEHSVQQDEKHQGHNKGEIVLSQEQIKTVGIEFGNITSIKINDYVNTTGVMGVPPSAYSDVSVKMQGILEVNKTYVEGNHIKKGEEIAKLVNPDLIRLQENYLTAETQFKLKKVELERLRFLYKEKAVALKDLQKTETEFNSLLTLKTSLEKQLSYYGVNTSSLTAEKISEKIPVYSPTEGYISTINMNNGMYVTPSNSIMQIVAIDHLHLELDVFESDISKVKKGQKITYTVPSQGDEIFEGEVSVIGKDFNLNNKTIRVHGHLKGETPTFYKGMFINAKIWLNDKVVPALPSEAIQQEGEVYFVYAGKPEGKEVQFRKVNVKTGATVNGYTSVNLIDKLKTGEQFVVKGAYYIYAQSQAGELEHEH